MNSDYLGDTNARRSGKVFCVRLSDEQRAELTAKMRAAEVELPYDPTRRRGSLGHYIIWAALRYSPRQASLDLKPKNGRATDGTVRRNGMVVARRVRARRAGRKPAKRKGGRR